MPRSKERKQQSYPTDKRPNTQVLKLQGLSTEDQNPSSVPNTQDLSHRSSTKGNEKSSQKKKKNTDPAERKESCKISIPISVEEKYEKIPED